MGDVTGSHVHQGDSIREEFTVGDRFENISGSTIINRSTVENAFNRVQKDFDQETANALLKVAEEIEKSGNKEAAEMFESFNEELQKPEPKKPVLRSLWAGMVEAMPTLAQLTDVVAKISTLFS